MEHMIRNFIRSMGKEDKQRMLREFMSSMSEEEKLEIRQMMMPIMMESMKSLLMVEMLKTSTSSTEKNIHGNATQNKTEM